MATRTLLCAIGVLVSSGGLAGAETGWRVGLAKVRITPEGPIPLCGYGPQVSDGVLDELYAKAMAIEHGEGGHAVLVTADLLFFRAPMAEAVYDGLWAVHGSGWSIVPGTTRPQPTQNSG